MTTPRFLTPLNEHVQENFERAIQLNLTGNAQHPYHQARALFRDLAIVSCQLQYLDKGITIQEKILEKNHKLLSDFLKSLISFDNDGIVIGTANSVQYSGPDGMFQSNKNAYDFYLHIPAIVFKKVFPKTSVMKPTVAYAQNPNIFLVGESSLNRKASATQAENTDAKHAGFKKPHS
jgi:hypothetical protein